MEEQADDIIYACSAVHLTPKMREEKELEMQMRKALQDNQGFFVNFQPEIDLADMRIAGWEALARWQIPVRGLVPPDVFIPIAEQTGLIVPLGRQIMDKTLFQAHAWQEKVSYRMTVAVNISMKQFERDSLVPMIMEKLEQWDVLPETLEIELTESSLMQDPDRTIRALKELANLGVHITIDDFGTGYSSFASLSKLPLNKLKIDRSFLKAIYENEKGLPIMQAMVQLGHLLGLKVVVEGAETVDDFKVLKSIGCDYSQGYYTGRPMDEENATAFLEKNLSLRQAFFEEQWDLPL